MLLAVTLSSCSAGNLWAYSCLTSTFWAVFLEIQVAFVKYTSTVFALDKEKDLCVDLCLRSVILFTSLLCHRHASAQSAFVASLCQTLTRFKS